MPNDTKMTKQFRKDGGGLASPASQASPVRTTPLRTNKHRTPSWWLSVFLTYLLLAAGSVIMVVPFLFSFITSLKTKTQFDTTDPLTLPSPLTFDNYTALFGDKYNFIVPIAVTVQVVLVLTVGQMVFSVLAAYAFARLRFPGREVIFGMYVATLMVPPIVTMIPLYSMLAPIGLRNTFLGLVLPFMLGSPYAIFLLRQNFQAVPQEILDAARIDGAGQWRTLWSIVLPMNRPILATLLLITVVTQWNNFLWPSIIAPTPQWNVLTVATSALQTQFDGNWTLVMAATTIALAPLIILFLIFNKQIVQSLGISGFK